jgi:tryptophanyl-tRNA synthetase
VTEDRRIALTGIKPTGTPHLGNYLGMIRPALELAKTYQAMYFIADYHALTTTVGDKLTEQTYDVAAAWLALGLDPGEVIFYRQSDVPEVVELAWILACFTPKGLLNRAHAYKAAVDQNQEAGRAPDDGINAGLFGYPVLMAADILMMGTEAVPVGQDQRQHLEMTRDMAEAFNREAGSAVLTVPEAVIREEVATILGLDGRKMSKSYDNIIPIFAPPDQLRKLVMRIVTDSRAPEEPKDPETDNVFGLYRHFAPPEMTAALRERYLHGGVAYSAVKEELYQLLEETFGPMRRRYQQLVADRAYLDGVLREGAKRARAMAIPLLERVRMAIGTNRRLSED